LGALKPLVNTAFDFATGNLPGIIQDLTSLISQFSKGDFTNNVATRQPLPEAFNDNSYNSNTAENEREADRCCSRDSNNELSTNRLGELFKLLSDIFSSTDANQVRDKMGQLFKLLTENANNRDTLQNARTNVFFSGTVNTTA
jgi:hypothetical protein